jgi:DNA-binding transcriptional ArsR family regulator
MAPIELDLNSEQSMVDVIPSKLAEMMAVIQLLANRKQYAFENEFAEALYGRLTDGSKAFVDSLEGLRFPGVEFFGFFMQERNFHDFDRFIKSIEAYSLSDFLYYAFDRDASREQVEAVLHGKMELSDFISAFCCHLWKGNEGPLKALLFDTENYRGKLLKLAGEIYRDAGFEKATENLAYAYRQATEDIRRRLQKLPPMELAMEIKGKSRAPDRFYRQYYFIPSYFMNEFNVTAWDEDKGIFILFYNIKTSEKVDMEEIDGILSILKSLSDRTRLQILQSLRKKPSYGKKLAEELKLSTASISRQLDQLRSMNLITEEKSDGFKYFRLNSREIDKLVHSVQEFFSTK